MEYMEKLKQADNIARKVLNLSRNSLFVNLRFLENALGWFRMMMYNGSMGTNGENIYYNPHHILLRYKQNAKLPTHDFLHMVLHCVFRHWFVGFGINRDFWNIACDIAVENIILDLNLKFIENEKAGEKISAINKIQKNIKLMTAENIYAYFMDSNISENVLEKYAAIFSADDHSVWYKNPNEISNQNKPDHDDQNSDNDSDHDTENQNGDSDSNPNEISNQNKPDHDDQNSDNDSDHDTESQNSDSDSDAQDRMQTTKEELEKQWKSISEYIQSEFENFAKQQGIKSGNMVQQLQAINREKYDYTAFLKKFAVMGEVMKVNMDEFDYNFYTYGLSLYKNVALIEPLEYKEVKRIREFVIAIDTSGSVSGELVQKFITKTYNILKNTDSFFSKVNIHIIQCDAEIQESVKITSQEEFDEYIKTMELKGFGGTDFRPVFGYVDKMIKNKEFTNLKGLIYFTDGYGTFPERKPDYETAFVFIRDEYDQPEVPVWAIKLVLEENEIYGGKYYGV